MNLGSSSVFRNRAMPVNNPQLQRRTSLLNAWFIRLDSEDRGLLRSGRLRLLLLGITLLL